MQVFKNNVSLEATPTGDTHVTNKGYVDGTVESLLDDTSTRSDRTWSSEKISKINVTDAKKVDEKPTYSAGTITYVKNGTSYTTTNDKQWFYYLENEALKQTIFIDGEELTLGNANIDLDDYIEKNDIVTTFDNTCTDEQVASALAIYNMTKDKNMKTYNTVKQLGLSFPCTVSDIFLAMDTNSVVYIGVEALASTVTDVPYGYGLLTISKITYGRFSILYNISAGGSVTKNRMWIGNLKGEDGTGLVWKEILTTDTGYITTNQPVIDGTTTDVTTLPPGHYIITTGSSTSMNLPFDDTTNYNGTLFIIGKLNDPANNKGYRVMLYFDNKSRSAINHEWWGTYMGWKIISTV